MKLIIKNFEKRHKDLDLIIDIHAEMWFVEKQILEILDYQYIPNNHKIRYSELKKRMTAPTFKFNPKIIFINESAFLQLSHKPRVKKLLIEIEKQKELAIERLKEEYKRLKEEYEQLKKEKKQLKKEKKQLKKSREELIMKMLVK